MLRPLYLHHFFCTTYLTVFALLAAALVSTNAMADAIANNEMNGDEKPRLLVIGGLHAELEKLEGVIDPMAEYIERKMADIGPVEVVVVFAQDREHMARLIQHGRVDWISQTAYNAIYFLNHADVSIIARGWRGGSPTYNSVFFVRKDSNISSLSELQNHTIAFEHPYSTSAFFIPKIELTNHVAGLEMLIDEQSSPALNHIGYRFSRSEYNSALWVHKGIVDAAVFSGIHWDNYDVVPPEIRQDLRVIHQTDDIVRAVEIVRNDLDDDIKTALRVILTNIHTDAEAEEVRKKYYRTMRFDEFQGDEFEKFKRLTEGSEYGSSIVSKSIVGVTRPEQGE